jgi:hypothetical protein
MNERSFDYQPSSDSFTEQTVNFFESIRFFNLTDDEKEYFLEARRQRLYSDEVMLDPSNHSAILRLRHTALHEIAHVKALVRGGGTFIKATVVAGRGYLGMAVGIPKSPEHAMAFAAASEIGEKMMGISDHRGGRGDRFSIASLANRLSALKYRFKVSADSLKSQAYRDAQALISGVSKKEMNTDAVSLVKQGTVLA